MLFNVVKEMNIISELRADSKIAPEVNPPTQLNTLKTNSDGSINVRMVSADVIEVKPAYNAEFKVVPSGSYTTFKVEPYSSSTTFSVEPKSSSTTFNVEPKSSSTTFKVAPSSYTSFEIKPASGAVFNVRQEGGSYIASEGFEQINQAYPNPAQNDITFEYNIQENEYLTICDINGRMVNRTLLDATQNSVNVNVSDYPAGAYIYSHGRVSGKFVKK